MAPEVLHWSLMTAYQNSLKFSNPLLFKISLSFPGSWQSHFGPSGNVFQHFIAEYSKMPVTCALLLYQKAGNRHSIKLGFTSISTNSQPCRIQLTPKLCLNETPWLRNGYTLCKTSHCCALTMTKGSLFSLKQVKRDTERKKYDSRQEWKSEPC